MADTVFNTFKRDLFSGTFDLVNDNVAVVLLSGAPDIDSDTHYSDISSLEITSTGYIEMFWPDYRNKRSQDLPTAYHDAGQFYWGDTEKFLKEKALYTKKSVPVVLPRFLVHDIDTPEDWETAEKMFLVLGLNNQLELF